MRWVWILVLGLGYPAWADPIAAWLACGPAFKSVSGRTQRSQRDPALQAELAAFETALEGFKGSQIMAHIGGLNLGSLLGLNPGEKVGALMKAAENLLTAQNVAFRSEPTADGNSRIVILPGEQTGLNRLAKELADEHGGTLVYSPAQFSFLTGATYHRATRTVSLPSDGLTPERSDMLIRHEFRHAAMHRRERNGQNSLFLGEAGARDGAPDLFKVDLYNRHMSLEEMITYPEDLAYLGRELRTELLRPNRDISQVTELVKELDRRSRGTAEMSSELAAFLKRTIEHVEKDPSLLQVVRQDHTADDGSNMPVWSGAVLTDQSILRLPTLFGSELQGDMKAYLNQRLAASGAKTQEEVRTAFDRIIAEMTLSKLREVHRVVQELSREAKALNEFVNNPSQKDWLLNIEGMTQRPLAAMTPHVAWTHRPPNP